MSVAVAGAVTGLPALAWIASRVASWIVSRVDWSAVTAGTDPVGGLALTTGYRPVHLIVGGIGVLALAAVTAEVLGLAAANKRHARARREHGGYVDGAHLPDTPPGAACPWDGE